MGRWPLQYAVLFLSCLLGIGAVEAVLLNIKYDYFRGGFLAQNVLNTTGLRFWFLFSSLITDSFLILLIWTISLPILSKILKLSNSRLFVTLAFITIAIPFACDYVIYELRSYLSDLIDLKLLWQLVGNSTGEVIVQSSEHLTYMAIAFFLAVFAFILVIIIWRRDEIPGLGRLGQQYPPGMRVLLVTTGLMALAGASALSLVMITDNPLGFGLVHKPSGIALRSIVEVLSDVDRDGYGFMSKPRDPAPFDRSIHPYAIDIPGNGIDENGVAGDHPAHYQPSMRALDENRQWERRPNVLIILLESVRADVVEQKVNGHEIAPFMHKIAMEGAQSKMAYCHCASTVPSRAQLFGGRLLPYPGQSTLIDDFKRNGYYVAYFSGQDDSFGDSGRLIGYQKADAFYDARSDKESRYTTFSTPASLAVSCKLVNQRVISFLDSHTFKNPLFIYVNYHDTHFPYHHRELDNILDIIPLSREKIRPGASEAIWRTYANAVANVDRAIEELFNALIKKLAGEPLIVIITSDHAESLFENGFLGHGYSVDDEQTRVPFIVWGEAGTWCQPLGLADVRAQLLENLSRPALGNTRPQIVTDPSRRVLQHVGPLRSPRLLAWRTVEDVQIYDFYNDETIIKRNGNGTLESRQKGLVPNLIPLIWDWESIVGEEIPSSPAKPKSDFKWQVPG